MLRETVSKAACLLLLIGLASGLVVQIELLTPGILFLSQSISSQLITLHIWATSLSLLIIFICTISLLRHKDTWALWGIWLGFALIPILVGTTTQSLLNKAGLGAYLSDTLYVTASRHAFGIAVLMISLGGLSALTKMKRKMISGVTSIIFAFFITGAGTILTLAQSSLGLNGMPRRYIDYPTEFAPVQLYASIAALACLSFAVAYLVYLWRCPTNTENIEDIF